MKNKLLLAVGLAIVLASIYGLRKVEAQSLTIRYETGMTVVVANEDIKVNIYNPDIVAHNYRVVIQASETSNPGPLTLLADSGVASLPAQQEVHFDYAVPTGTIAFDYEATTTTDSHLLIPTMTVVPESNGIPRYWQDQFIKR